jgi:short-subunit dehydrogenase
MGNGFFLNTGTSRRIGEALVQKISEKGIPSSAFCLLNNASAVEPFGSMKKSPVSEIESNVRISLIAPMILTSLFIKNILMAEMGRK